MIQWPKIAESEIKAFIAADQTAHEIGGIDPYICK